MKKRVLSTLIVSVLTLAGTLGVWPEKSYAEYGRYNHHYRPTYRQPHRGGVSIAIGDDFRFSYGGNHYRRHYRQHPVYVPAPVYYYVQPQPVYYIDNGCH